MIEIKNLVFSYGKTPVLDNITTSLEEGRIYEFYLLIVISMLN